MVDERDAATEATACVTASGEPDALASVPVESPYKVSPRAREIFENDVAAQMAYAMIASHIDKFRNAAQQVALLSKRDVNKNSSSDLFAEGSGEQSVSALEVFCAIAFVCALSTVACT